ncbi:hypothetical protein SAMN04487769_0103 [Burkholderia sp. b14]|nr:hypothetical protein SAMN04487769_0103 [Burkholderia sp. b14]
MVNSMSALMILWRRYRLPNQEHLDCKFGNAAPSIGACCTCGAPFDVPAKGVVGSLPGHPYISLAVARNTYPDRDAGVGVDQEASGRSAASVSLAVDEGVLFLAVVGESIGTRSLGWMVSDYIKRLGARAVRVTCSVTQC